MNGKTSKSDRPKSARPASRSRSTPIPAKSNSEATKRQFAQVTFDKHVEHYLLRLYVTGTTPASSRAIEKVRGICEEYLRGRYDLEVIDIYQKPALAKDEQIIATPTLIKVLPAPLRRFIGDLSKMDKVLFGLDLLEKR
jgi:circadian clock protein KaiB